jgi:hypothetical protein
VPEDGAEHRGAARAGVGAECLLRQADRYRPREFGTHESDGAPDEKESRPKHEPPGYQACMMAR